MTQLHLSTNAQQELDDANIVYTEVPRFAPVASDGTIEHTAVDVWTDVKPKSDPNGQRYLLAGLSNEEYAARVAQYRDVLVPAMRAADPDFDEVVDACSEPLDNLSGRIILAGVHNGPLCLKYLAERPHEIQRINKLAASNPAAAQQRIVEISADIATNEAANLDKADMATFKRVRARQERRWLGGE